MLGQIAFAFIVVLIVTMLFSVAERLWRHWRSRGQDEINWGLRMQTAAEAHLAGVNEALLLEEEGQTDVDNPAFAPYCGCDTCTVREVLAGAWPVIAELAEHAGKYDTKLHLQSGDRDA